MGKIRIRLIFAICIILMIIPLAGKFLYLNQRPVKADAIIVLSGDLGRLEEGIRLYEQGYAKTMILTNAAEFQQEAILANIPETSLIKEYNAISTESNAGNTKHLMQANGLSSALVVTSDYHTKRTSIIFNSVYKDSGIQLTFISARNPRFDLSKWYMSPRGIKEIAKEYTKLFLFEIGVSKYIEPYIVPIRQSPLGFILS